MLTLNMPTLFAFDFVLFILGFAVFFISLFLILIVLVQRGKGGGLTGALGGMGGSSAFGTKAGDVFTKITSYTAIVWILLCIIMILNHDKPAVISDEPGIGAAATSGMGETDPGTAKEDEGSGSSDSDK